MLFRVWATRAFRLLQTCYDENKAHTEMIVKCTSKRWGQKTPMELAVAAENHEFLGHLVVQRVLAKAWMGDLQVQTPTRNVRLSENDQCCYCNPRH